MSSSTSSYQGKQSHESHFCESSSRSSSYLLRPSCTDHLGKQRQYWRDIILGINDGIVSTFLLVVGVSGGGLSSKDIFITAVSGALAGSISMFAELLSLIGIPKVGQDSLSLRNQLLQFYSSNEDALLKVMVALEFGVLEKERRQPFLAGLTSGFLFLVGSLPSVIPFALCVDPMNGLFVAIVCTGITLFIVGIVKSFATRMNWIYSSFENFIIAGLGGVVAFYFGSWLQ